MLFLNQKEFDTALNINWTELLPEKLLSHLNTIGLDRLPVHEDVTNFQAQLRAKIADADGMIIALEKVKDTDFFLTDSHPLHKLVCDMLTLEIKMLHAVKNETWKILSRVIQMDDVTTEFKELTTQVADLIKEGEFDKADEMQQEFILKLQQQKS